MTREIDAREARGRDGAPLLDDARRAELHDAAAAASDQLPGAHTAEVVSFDNETGNPAVVVSTSAAPSSGNYVTRALQHVQRLGRVLGLAAEQPADFVADPEYQTTSAGAVAVQLRQQYKGIPIYDAAETVRFDADGRLLETAGRTFTVPSELAVQPALAPAAALEVAARWVGSGDTDAPRDPFGEPMTEPALDLTHFAPVATTVAANQPDRATVFDAPPFEHAVTVSLIWFPMPSGLRLAWHTRLDVPGGGQYRVIVDAADASVLLCRSTARSILGRADVVLSSGQAAQSVELPLAINSYGAPVPGGLPAGFPDDWLTGASTDGASARAINAATGLTVQGAVSSGRVVFSTGGAGPDQLVVNVFTLCGAMHDVLYLLGFREPDGNFQTDNQGRGGRPSDAVLARVHPGPVWGTANMATPPDGVRPEMNMGLVTSTNRHTALDPDVVYHEYTHGLTNRLVGGPMNDTSLDADQSAGMGEGWSDFVACTILGKNVVGDWVVNRPVGIRRQAYTDSYSGTYADLGTADYSEVHDIGELWCAVLMSLSRQIGSWVCAQIVVDALKLTSANPSLLAARDAILLAADQFAVARGDTDPQRRAFVQALWTTFARYGMGPNALTDGPALRGIVADFNPPPFVDASTLRATVTPGLAIPDNDRTGIRSTIQLADVGTISAVAITVDITHPYVGDLVLAVFTPWGERILLRERAGASADDIRETYRPSGVSGQPAGGAWTLAVADIAAGDVGELVSWTIEVEVGEPPERFDEVVVVGAMIPDANAGGVASTVDVDIAGTVSAVTLSVDITHTYVGDLQVALAGPTGKRVVVHRRRGGGQDNLIVAYASADGGVLEPFVGLEASGQWTLSVSDHAARDVGKLNRWSLVVET